MLMKIFFQDDGNWPIMKCGELIVENKDKINIRNYGVRMHQIFNELCKMHYKATKEAKQLTKEGKTSKSVAITNLFHDLFYKEDNEKIAKLEAENKELKKQLQKYEPVYVTGS